jgi:uncharacterized membrane protein YhiD involved in acid resistance
MNDEMIQDAMQVAIPVLQAGVLSILFSAHPLRFKRLRTTGKGRELLKAQVLVCMAGALLVVVIGSGEDASARAFGLLGLGSFIRFRTSMKSPADTAIFFLLIGIGMACGVDRFGAAVVGTVLLGVVLTVLEMFSPAPIQDDKAEVDPG